MRISVLTWAAALTLAAVASAASPFAGRWNFTLTTPGGTRAEWLGITEKDGGLEVWFQPTGGNVYRVKNAKVEGTKLTLGLNGNSSIELEAKDGKLVGTQKQGTRSWELTGVRAPELKRPMPKNWTKPEPIFNGKDLTGWEPMGNPANSHWGVEDGLLVNKEKGANLKSTRMFDDFKLHFEVLCPGHSNSGFYLRGRYEIQLEYEPGSTAPPERRMGGIYGRIAPKVALPDKPGEWETFDVTFVGRTLTVVRNGTTIIDKAEVEGITGGAIDANEDQPGPFYVQGDHTGGLKFRNITIAVPGRK